MADQVIDVITIEIKGDTADAGKSIDNLIGTLGKLGKAVSGCNRSFSAVLKPLALLDHIASNFGGSGIDNIKKLADGLTSLGKVGKISIPQSLAEKIVNIGAAVDCLKGVDFSKLEEMAAALSTLSGVGDVKIPKFTSPVSGAATASTLSSLSGETTIPAGTDTEDTKETEASLKSLEKTLAKQSALWDELRAKATATLKRIGMFAVKAGFKVATGFGKLALAPVTGFIKKIQSAVAGLKRFLKSLQKIAMYRFVRTILREISEGFKEGTDNLYQYSKAFDGVFARSMDSISTSLLYLKNSIGAAAAPLINALAPAIDFIIDKFVDLLNMFNQVIAYLSGASSWTKAIRYQTEYAGAADDAAAANERLKKTILGIDELNVMQGKTPSGQGGGSAQDPSLMFEEVPLDGAVDFGNTLGEIFKVFKSAWEAEGQPTIDAFLSAFRSIRDLLDTIKNSFLTVFEGGQGEETLTSVMTIIQNILRAVDTLAKRFKKAWETNDVGTKILDNCWELLNDILDFINRIWSATADFLEDVDFEPLLTSIEGLTDALEPLVELIGDRLADLYEKVLLPLGKWIIEKAAPASIDALSSAIKFLSEHIDLVGGAIAAIAVAIGAMKVAGGVGSLIETLKGLGVNIGSLGGAAQTAGDAASGTASTFGSKLTPNLTTLVKNLGLGLVVILEVSAAALLIGGAIILLGMELEQVGIAWEPVIANGETIAIAMGLGIGVLAVVGAVTYGLGSAGGSLAASMGIGIAILAEIGVAAAAFIAEIYGIGWGLDQIGQAWQPVLDNGETIGIAIGIGTAILIVIGAACAALGIATTATGGLLPLAIGLGVAILVEMGVAVAAFVVEIWAIGVGLQKIGEAWQPVLDDGENIATAIGLGTALLIGIGVVTAALGVATVASAGLLPLAIGLGTALLVELATAVILFIESLVKVANSLGNDLAPALQELNGKLPSLSTDMSDFVDFMSAFAGQVVRYTEVSAVAGLAATIDTIVGWFTKDPIEKLTGDVNKISGQVKDLNEKLEIAVPELRTAAGLLTDYHGFLTQIQNMCNTNIELGTGLFINLKEVGQNLVLGFVEGIKSKADDFKNAATTLVDGFKTEVDVCASHTKVAFDTWTNNLKTWFTATGYGAINSATFGFYADTIVTGFNTGLSDGYPAAESAIRGLANFIKDTFAEVISYNEFYDIGCDIVRAFNAGVNSLYTTTRSYMKAWAKEAIEAFENELGHHSPGSGGGSSGSSSGHSGQGSGNSTINAIPLPPLPQLARGGVLTAGQMFIARENGAGAELIGRFGKQTGVMNNEQIVDSVSQGVADANSEQNILLREQNELLRKLLDKETLVRAIVDTDDVITGLARKNRRDGKTVIPVGI